MAEFKDSGLWVRLALLLMTVGFLLDLFGFATGLGASWGGRATEACMVIGFLCFLAGCFMLLCLVFLDELKDNKGCKIAIIVLCFVAGIATVIGIALWGGDGGRGVGNAINTYSTMIGAVGSLMAILAGIFMILDIVGVGGGK